MRLGRIYVLPVVLGLCDGILNALTLVAGRLVRAAQPLTATFALRVATAALASGAFVFFVARYSELRRDLVHEERELTLTQHGRLAATRLGRSVLKETVIATILASGFAFIGALLPLMAAVLFRRPFWIGGLITIVILGGLGIALARSVYGRALTWSILLMLSGLLLALIGVELHLL